MKFEEYLNVESVPEWQSKYINYKELKKVLKSVASDVAQHRARIGLGHHVVVIEENVSSENKSESGSQHANYEELSAGDHDESGIIGSENGYELEGETVPLRLIEHEEEKSRVSKESTEDRTIGITPEPNEKEYFEHIEIPRCSGRFFVLLYREVQKADEFFCQQEEEIQTKYLDLSRQTSLLDEIKDNDKKRKFKGDLKKAFLEFYRQLNLLKNFSLMNYSAAGKILKKFDKNTYGSAKKPFLEYISSMRIFSYGVLDALIQKTELLFAEKIFNGDRKQAMNTLRLPPSSQKSNFVIFRNGWYIGSIVPVIISILYKVIVDFEMFSNEEFGRIARIYAGIFVFLVFLWLIGVNVVVWKRYRVNYVFIFEFDPRHHLHVPNYFELISILTILQVYSFFFFVYRIGENYLDPDYYPVILFITYAVFILNPLNIIYRSSRYWLLNVFFRLVTTPLFKVEFKDFLVADLLCSQVYVLLGIQYTLCLYLSSSEDHLVCDPKRGVVTMIISMYPSTIRLLQCFRRYYDQRGNKDHLKNAGKYTSGVLVSVFAALYRMYSGTPLLVCWICFAIIGVIYSSAWDLIKDWGLLNRDSKNFFLRDKLMYPSKWFYYVAIPLNIILRSAWVITISENTQQPVLRDFFLALLEVYRRFQWTFFRLENEHLNNTDRFRAVKNVPLPFNLDDAHYLPEEKKKKKFWKDC